MARICFDDFISEIEKEDELPEVLSSEHITINGVRVGDASQDVRARKLVEYFHERQRLRKDLEFFS